MSEISPEASELHGVTESWEGFAELLLLSPLLLKRKVQLNFRVQPEFESLWVKDV